jgi:hypothetical protein
MPKEVKFGQRKEQPPASLDEWVDPKAKAGKKRRLTIDIDDDLHKRVKGAVGRRGTTIRDVVIEFLEREFPA